MILLKTYPLPSLLGFTPSEIRKTDDLRCSAITLNEGFKRFFSFNVSAIDSIMLLKISVL